MERVPVHMQKSSVVLVLSLALCFAGRDAQVNEPCLDVPASFIQHVQAMLSDSTDLFQGAYPPATPLTCELLGMLREELKDDSARYCFERLSRRYWSVDPHARTTHTYIQRYISFPLAMAAVAHWNEDHRLLGLKALQDYRHMRPMVCTTTEGNTKLELQDRAAVRYLTNVLETTPLWIAGSENSTIHDIFIREVVATLDLFTGQHHETTGDQRMRMDMNEERIGQAIADWRKWLNE
jgi:hypothetical protein